jgi:hypothetical protein
MNNPCGGGFVEDAGEALVVDVGEGGFEQHAGFDGAVHFEMHDDLIDEGHLVGLELPAWWNSAKAAWAENTSYSKSATFAINIMQCQNYMNISD